MVWCRYAGRDYPVDVRAKREKLNEDEAFRSYWRVYAKWIVCKELYEEAVKDLNKFEVANGFGEHQVLLISLISWSCL